LPDRPATPADTSLERTSSHATDDVAIGLDDRCLPDLSEQAPISRPGRGLRTADRNPRVLRCPAPPASESGGGVGQPAPVSRLVADDPAAVLFVGQAWCSPGG